MREIFRTFQSKSNSSWKFLITRAKTKAGENPPPFRRNPTPAQAPTYTYVIGIETIVQGLNDMRKSTPSISTAEVEERFLLQALRRLRTPEQRYVFTLMADLISHGMLADAKTGRSGTE